MTKSMPIMAISEFSVSIFFDFVVANANGIFVAITVIVRVVEWFIRRKKKK